LLGYCYLTGKAVRLCPLTHGTATSANKRERWSNVGVCEEQDDRQFVYIDSNGLFFTHALFRGPFLLDAFFFPDAFTELFPFPSRFALIGVPGSIWGRYNESQT
jgi:hypothetical protein